MICLCTHTHTHTAGVACSPGGNKLVYYIQLPVDTRWVQRSPFPVLLLLITAAPLPASGQTDLPVFSTALLVALLKNYLRFNSLLCNEGRVTLKHTQHKNRTENAMFHWQLEHLPFVCETERSCKERKKRACFLLFPPHNHLFFFLLLPTHQAIFRIPAKVDIWRIK